MRHRLATLADCPLLATLNHQLIRDEGHRNPMTVAQLEDRMRGWLSSGEYRAVIFEDDRGGVAYSLFRESETEVYLRQLFVACDRRREGIGRQAVRVLFENYFPRSKRWTVSVLVANEPAVAFWRAMGYRDYDLTLEIMPRP